MILMVNKKAENISSDMSLDELERKVLSITEEQELIAGLGLSKEVKSLAINELQETKNAVLLDMYNKVLWFCKSNGATFL